jgi:hypothetical protein
MGTYLRFIQTGRAEDMLRLAIAIAILPASMAGAAAACRPGLKEAAGACVAACPGGYEDRGATCVYRGGRSGGGQ